LQYIDFTREWATKQLQRNIDRKNNYRTLSINDYKRKSDYYADQKFYYNSPLWMFTPEFIDNMVKNAEVHYNQSIQKLAIRIEKKGLNIDKLEVKTAHVGVNIETTLTDGEKTVRAFTIVASGIVQRPHYRYLIK